MLTNSEKNAYRTEMFATRLTDFFSKDAEDQLLFLIEKEIIEPENLIEYILSELDEKTILEYIEKAFGDNLEEYIINGIDSELDEH